VYYAYGRAALGRALLRLGMPEDARAHLVHAIEILGSQGDPSLRVDAHADLADALEALGASPQAIDTARAAAEAAAGEPGARRRR
jgi:tetratricopeptide (TPR) repeat protein